MLLVEMVLSGAVECFAEGHIQDVLHVSCKDENCDLPAQGKRLGNPAGAQSLSHPYDKVKAVIS